MAFKMKGWSGNQSPIKQKTSFADSKIRPKTIKYDETTKKSTSGLGLTMDEKKAAKKAGMSEWQGPVKVKAVRVLINGLKEKEIIIRIE